MPLHFTVLGGPGRDNAVFVRVESGQKVSRLLFDCGEACLAQLPIAEVQAIDHILFSHFHMDHISGFDSLFRVTYNRTVKPNLVWGPPGAGQIMQHRFQGFLWNLHHEAAGFWDVHDLSPDRIEGTRFFTREAFAVAHPLPPQPRSDVILETPEYSISAYQMDHLTPSMAYLVREKPRLNVDTERLAALGLRPGGWLQALKTPREGETPTIELEGQTYALADLRGELLAETPGQSLAYLTDFLMDRTAQERLARVLQGCSVIICESQYRQADHELAARNYHMTATQAAETARLANAQQLVLFHLSDRYRHEEWTDLLAEARVVFPNTNFPDGWMAGS
ncbi:MAG TPA: MBL fold metallo-hydrolase [Ktedonobacterales bacterium]|jgi:ribonuclease Z